MALLVVALGGCTTDAAPPTIHIVDQQLDTSAIGIQAVEINGDDRGADLCALAAALPASDVCSLACEPDQFAAALLAEGMHAGACYHIRCALSETTTVSVGVCLP